MNNTTFINKKKKNHKKNNISAENMNVENFGQVFTPQSIVKTMIDMRKNHKKTLEPSAGDGAFLSLLDEGSIAIEIDKIHADKSGAINMDFFDYPVSYKFDTIIGNPPYVRHQDIIKSTKEKLNNELFDARTNLYLFFIEKSLKHLNENGEIIFITPRDFIKATAAKKLNQLLYDNGTITDFIETGDARIFKNATPNCAIWRFEKNNFSRITNKNKIFTLSNGQIIFTGKENNKSFSDLFYVKVGAVSGMDQIFENEQFGNKKFVCSHTAKTGKTRKMIYNTKNDFLLKHKEKLISRKIKKFNENNWWMWGRDCYFSDSPRIYVNTKTRNKKPFFTHNEKYYDGSVLAIFPYDKNIDIKLICDKLNKIDWDEMGFVCDNRFLFTQRSLQHCMLPSDF